MTTITQARAEAVPGTAQQLSRSQILSATEHVLQKDGYDGTTIRRIAGHLDCAVGSIYRYFRDKRDLLAAVTEQMLLPVVTALDGGEGFELSVRRYHALATQHPETYRLMFWVAYQEFDHAEAAAQLTSAPARPALEGVPAVVRQVITGWTTLLGDDAKARQSWALLHGMVQLGSNVETVIALLSIPVQPTTPQIDAGTAQAEPAPAEPVVIEPALAPEPQPEIIITMVEPPRPKHVALVPEDVTLL